MLRPTPCRIAVSPRFELFFALAAVLGADLPTPPDDLAARWLVQARRKLEPGFRRRLGELAAPAIWHRLSLLPAAAALDGETRDVIDALADLAPDAFTGLAGDPQALQSAATDTLRRFDRLAFAAFWRSAAPRFTALAQSRWPDRAAELESDATICFPSMFAPAGHTAMLVSPAGDEIVARFLSAAEHFDLPVRAATAPRPRAVADPAAIFRALGDTTRYAIARLIAREALTSADLARRLGVSGPTLTHHLKALRQARLVIEERRGNSILLRLDRRVIETLAAASLAAFYGSDRAVPIRRSRTFR